MTYIKIITLTLVALMLASCSDPKAELLTQEKELSAKIISLQDKKKDLKIRNSKINDEAEIFVLEVTKQRKSQQVQSMGFYMNQGLSNITGNYASASEAAAQVDLETSQTYDAKIFNKKLQMLKDEYSRNTKEITKVSKEIRTLKIERKKIRDQLKQLESEK